MNDLIAFNLDEYLKNIEDSFYLVIFLATFWDVFLSA